MDIATIGTIGAYVILGIVQGLTEFLPVSSSGHLIIARDILHLNTPSGLAVDAVLQFATVLAVVMYFWRDIWQMIKTAWYMLVGQNIKTNSNDRTLLFALIVGTIPAVLAGLFLEKIMDTAFRSAALVAWMLIAGSGLFLIAEYVASRYEVKKTISIGRGIVVGLFQSLALIPGMSRSGATISGGLLLGLSREEAARFGFLLSVPIILGAGAKKILELGVSGLLAAEWLPLVIGSIVAFAVGLVVIHYLLRYVRNHTLLAFVVYRLVLAAAVFVFLMY
jgi:undecaprenyl-diphosphatase